MSGFRLIRSDPVLYLDDSFHSSSERQERGVIALDIQTKYQFVAEGTSVFHEYRIPGSTEIQNCGGYVDKIAKYRDPELLSYLRDSGVSREAFATARFPLLATRSPQLDLLVYRLIRHLRTINDSQRVSLFDHGCSVGEHFDFLDTMMLAETGERAADLISYCGLDISGLLLHAARLLHADTQPEHFRLIQAEGSALDFPDHAFDITLTVGVVNHVADPLSTIRNLLRGTRHAAVMALWVTSQERGFFAINHSGNGAYFFSREDLAALQRTNPDGRFLVADFIPETSSTQRRSYVGISAEREASLGCYHLVFSRLPQVPFPFDALAF
jgi:SAM-dependent methyltransferase